MRVETVEEDTWLQQLLEQIHALEQKVELKQQELESIKQKQKPLRHVVEYRTNFLCSETLTAAQIQQLLTNWKEKKKES